VQQDGELGDIQLVANFLTAARDGTLPAVSWIVPNGDVSEHTPARAFQGGRSRIAATLHKEREHTR
jgi:phospholipase C